ncbi:MAG: alpha-N-arabinofuranosidase, partial [Phycisphaerae bacterium]
MLRARAKLDLDRQIGAICPLIFGQFVEHLGRCVYGGIYEEGSALADEDGFRTDVLAAVAELGPPIVRYPGGNFVSGYRWLDGVGPKDRRPSRWDRAWKTVETNRFGTNEFIQWCRRVGSEPYICVNLGDGTPTEAANWLEYCNAATETHFAELRRAHGFDQPHNVRYWGLGNELYGPWQIGSKDAATYAAVALDAARSMRAVDRQIKLVAVGYNGQPDWNSTVLRALWDQIDYLALHVYLGCEQLESHLASGLIVEHHVRQMRSAIEMVAAERFSDRPVRIAFDEWNVFYRAGQPAHEERYDLADALVVAQFLNVMIRHCDMVTLANMAQLVNVLAPIFTSPSGLFRQSIYWPLWLYRRTLAGVGLDVFCDGPTYRAPVHLTRRHAPERDVPVLDLAGGFDQPGRRVCLAVVNRSPDRPVELTIDGIDLSARGQAWM